MPKTERVCFEAKMKILGFGPKLASLCLLMFIFLAVSFGCFRSYLLHTRFLLQFFFLLIAYLMQIHADETKSSLQFASRALRVTNCARVNEVCL